jgi:hypothetical protein
LFNVTNKLDNVILAMLDFYNLNEHDDLYSTEQQTEHQKLEATW